MKTKLEVLQMEKRQSGYYWVKLPGNPPEWKVGEYFDRTDEWYLCGLCGWHSDEDFLEINEQQIKQTKKTTMKAWKEFIEFTIPEKSERENFRMWIKNALFGIRNKRALILYGPGSNGKGIITYVLSKIIDNSCFMLDITPNMCGKSVVFLEDISKRNVPYIKLMLDNDGVFSVPQRPKMYSQPSMEWPDIVMVVNEMPVEGLLRRSILINTPNTPAVANPHMAEELLEGADGILDWFLNNF